MQTYMEFPDGTVFQTERPEYHPEAKRLGATEGKRKRAEYCRAELLKVLQPGDTVYTVLRHVSGSGMSRRIDLYAIKDNAPLYLSGYAGGLMDYKLHDKGGLVVSGCGMDMGFHLVYSLARMLWRDGAPWEPKHPKHGSKDPGYALNHRWL